MPLITVGKIGFRSGLYMASTDELYVKVIGKGGHGAMPHLNVDTVLIASHIIVALQQIVSRAANPIIPSVLSFGKVIANGATNVMPNEVFLEGTFRTLDEKWRSEAHEKMKKLAEQLAESMGGKCEFEIRKGYPFLMNDIPLTEKMKTHARVIWVRKILLIWIYGWLPKIFHTIRKKCQLASIALAQGMKDEELYLRFTPLLLM
jgi:amidohydrolase